MNIILNNIELACESLAKEDIDNIESVNLPILEFSKINIEKKKKSPISARFIILVASLIVILSVFSFVLAYSPSKEYTITKTPTSQNYQVILKEKDKIYDVHDIDLGLVGVDYKILESDKANIKILLANGTTYNIQKFVINSTILLDLNMETNIQKNNNISYVFGNYDSNTYSNFVVWNNGKYIFYVQTNEKDTNNILSIIKNIK